MSDNAEWTIGKEEYSRQEVESLLSTQRAMIFNDFTRLLTKQKGTGKRSSDELEQYDLIQNPRKPEY